MAGLGPGAARQELAALGVRPAKRLGQNFLIDPNVVARTIEALGNDARACVVEIGPGLGALTLPLAEQAERLVAVEIDRRLAARLRAILATSSSAVEIVEGDILEYDFPATASRCGRRLVVVGSIPYSVTAPILKRLVDARGAIESAYVVTQREVAEKVLASPGPDGTALGILVQAYADVSVLRAIPRHAFYPVPDVDSQLWKLSFLARSRFASREGSFFAVVRAIYGARRKTLRNALRREFAGESADAILARAGLSGQARGETLGFAELDALGLAVDELEPQPSSTGVVSGGAGQDRQSRRDKRGGGTDRGGRTP